MTPNEANHRNCWQYLTAASGVSFQPKCTAPHCMAWVYDTGHDRTGKFIQLETGRCRHVQLRD